MVLRGGDIDSLEKCLEKIRELPVKVLGKKPEGTFCGTPLKP
jgi:hypothetical protein